jgi:hypothetical protein
VRSYFASLPGIDQRGLLTQMREVTARAAYSLTQADVDSNTYTQLHNALSLDIPVSTEDPAGESEAPSADQAQAPAPEDLASLGEQNGPLLTTFGSLREQMMKAESSPHLLARLEKHTPEWEFFRYAGRRITGHEGFSVRTVEALAQVFRFELDLSPNELEQMPLSRAVDLLKRHFRSARASGASMSVEVPASQAPASAANATAQSAQAYPEDASEGAREVPHPNGPEAPHWLWWANKRIRIGTDRSRLSWLLMEYFWERDFATYEDLQGDGKPWSDPVTDSAVATAVNRFKNDIPREFPWLLATKNRRVYKKSRENPAK